MRMTLHLMKPKALMRMTLRLPFLYLNLLPSFQSLYPLKSPTIHHQHHQSIQKNQLFHLHLLLNLDRLLMLVDVTRQWELRNLLLLLLLLDVHSERGQVVIDDGNRIMLKQKVENVHLRSLLFQTLMKWTYQCWISSSMRLSTSQVFPVIVKKR